MCVINVSELVIFPFCLFFYKIWSVELQIVLQQQLLFISDYHATMKSIKKWQVIDFVTILFDP